MLKTVLQANHLFEYMLAGDKNETEENDCHWHINNGRF